MNPSSTPGGQTKEMRVRRVDPRTWLLAIGAFATGTDAQIVSGLLPQLARDLGVQLGAAGAVVSVYALTYAVSAPLLAAATVHIRRDRAAVAAMAVFTLANAMCALASSYAMLIAARILAGVAGGLFIPTAYALAASLAPAERRGTALSVVAFGITSALVAGVPLGIYAGTGFGWQAAFWLIAGLSLASTLAIAAAVPAPAAIPPALGFAERFAPLVHLKTLVALSPTALCLALNGGIYTYLGAMMVDRGYPTGAVIAAFAAYGMGALIGSQTAGRLVDRHGPLRPMAGVIVVQIVVAIAFAPALGSIATTIVMSFVLGASPWPVVLGQQRRLMTLSPLHVEVMLAMNNSFVYLGIALGTAFCGVLLSHIQGLAILPAACTAFPVLAGAMLLARSPRRSGSSIG